METIINLAELAILGALASIFIEWLKTKQDFSSNKKKLITIGVSVVVGSLYYFVSPLPIWTTILAVLASASTIYALLIKDLKI